MDKYEEYLYYKGEKHNPYESKDKGKAFWWKAELYAAENKDRKEKNRLSETIKEYILEQYWEGDTPSDTTRELALQRATEMYRAGVWSRNYICIKDYKIDYVFTDNSF